MGSWRRRGFYWRRDSLPRRGWVRMVFFQHTDFLRRMGSTLPGRSGLNRARMGWPPEQGLPVPWSAQSLTPCWQAAVVGAVRVDRDRNGAWGNPRQAVVLVTLSNAAAGAAVAIRLNMEAGIPMAAMQPGGQLTDSGARCFSDVSLPLLLRRCLQKIVGVGLPRFSLRARRVPLAGCLAASL